MLLVSAACAGNPAGNSLLRARPSRHQLTYPEQWSQSTSFRFLVLGDTQNPKPGHPLNQVERRAIYDRLAAALADSVDPVAFVFHVGDIVENGANAGQWERYFDTLFWDRLTADQKTRFFPLPGNHEYKSHLLDYGGDDLARYYERFPHIQGQRYYFFTYGDAAFITMDAGRNGIAKVLGGERWQNGVEEQRAWLREVVFPHLRQQGAAGELKRVFVFFHKPGYVTPIKLRNRQSVEMLELFDEFNRASAHQFEIFAFSGHIHTFAHIVKAYNQDGSGAIDQFITGGGGGTQRGRKYYRKVSRVQDLDSFRLEKYRARVPEGEFDQALFDQLRLDNTLFGYLEVVVEDDGRVRVIYHRVDRNSGDFVRDYEVVR